VLETREQAGDVDTGTDELLGNDSLVAERWWLRGSADGQEQLDGHGITMHRIMNGRRQENWAVFHPGT
jgi:hypothetical protein